MLAFEELLIGRRSGGAGAFQIGGEQMRFLRAREFAENEGRLVVRNCGNLVLGRERGKRKVDRVLSAIVSFSAPPS